MHTLVASYVLHLKAESRKSVKALYDFQFLLCVYLGIYMNDTNSGISCDAYPDGGPRTADELSY
jgi:hypothetical protein